MHARRRALLGGLLGSVLLVRGVAARASADPKTPSFALGRDPAELGWKPLALPGKAAPTQWRIESVDGVAALRADADTSMSALAAPVAVDPAMHPWLRWRWRVDRVVARGQIGTKAGDDFAARVYVFFAVDERKLPLSARMRLRFARSLYGDAVPAAALCYVWDGRAPTGATGASPYTDRVQVVVATGREQAPGAWVEVRRDLARDFREAFTMDVPAVTAIAVASDTDNTGERVTAWFDGFTFEGR